MMVQSGAHYALVYYIHTFEFSTVLLAKSTLAVIVDKIEEYFQHYVKLSDRELSNVQAILTTSVKTKNLYVKLADRQGSSDYHIIGILEMLRLLTANPDNVLSLGSSIFIELYHSMLMDPSLCDAAKEVLLLLKIVCGHPANKRALQEENFQLLATLENLATNETLQNIAVEVIWSILNEDSSTGMYKYTTQ